MVTLGWKCPGYDSAFPGVGGGGRCKQRDTITPDRSSQALSEKRGKLDFSGHAMTPK